MHTLKLSLSNDLQYQRMKWEKTFHLKAMLVTAMMRLQVAKPVIPTRPPESVPRTAPNLSFFVLKGDTYFPSGVTSPCLFIKFVRGMRTLFSFKYLQEEKFSRGHT